MRNDWVDGAAYPLKGLRFLSAHPTLWRYIAWPLALNVVLGGLLSVALLWAGWQSVDALVARLPEWLQFLDWLLRAVAIIVGLYLTGWLVTRIGIILGAPFYTRLAEVVEEMRLPGQDSPPPMGIFRDMGRALAFELKKLGLGLGVSACLLAANVVPVVGQVAAGLGGITLAALLVCLDCFDPALDRRRLGFRAKLGVIGRHWQVSAGFGGVGMLLVGIPVVNLFTIPVLMVSGTLLYCDRLSLVSPAQRGGSGAAEGGGLVGR